MTRRSEEEQEEAVEDEQVVCKVVVVAEEEEEAEEAEEEPDAEDWVAISRWLTRTRLRSRSRRPWSTLSGVGVAKAGDDAAMARSLCRAGRVEAAAAVGGGAAVGGVVSIVRWNEYRLC